MAAGSFLGFDAGNDERRLENTSLVDGNCGETCKISHQYELFKHEVPV